MQTAIQHKLGLGGMGACVAHSLFQNYLVHGRTGRFGAWLHGAIGACRMGQSGQGCMGQSGHGRIVQCRASPTGLFTLLLRRLWNLDSTQHSFTCRDLPNTCCVKASLSRPSHIQISCNSSTPVSHNQPLSRALTMGTRIAHTHAHTHTIQG